MSSPIADKAIEEARQYGKAILKFVSANDCGATGAHQAGFYLPKSVWKLYSPSGPKPGENFKHPVHIVWQGGAYETDSVVTWYGKGETRNPRREYRLTVFGRNFPYLNPDSVGELFVLIPRDIRSFIAYVIDLPEDIEDIQAALGVEVITTWAIYDADREPAPIDEKSCVDLRFRKFAEENPALFPSGDIFSAATRETMLACIANFHKKSLDSRLMLLMESEYRLFKLVERQLCIDEVRRLFKDVDDFLTTAGTIMNRRKSRAGRSMENHVEYLLKEAGIPFDVRPDLPGIPDIIIPGKAAYQDAAYPVEKLFMVGVKTTCKDRWGQVLKEAPRIPHKHLLTLQEGVSAKQIKDIYQNNITLVVPAELHGNYPKDERSKLLKVEDFVKHVRQALA